MPIVSIWHKSVTFAEFSGKTANLAKFLRETFIIMNIKEIKIWIQKKKKQLRKKC